MEKNSDDNNVADIELDTSIIENTDTDRLYYLDSWKDAIVQIAQHYRLDISEQNIHIASVWSKEQSNDEVIKSMAKQAGMALKFSAVDDVKLSIWIVPLIVEMNDGHLAILKTIYGDGNVDLSFVEDNGLITTMTYDEVKEKCRRFITLRPLKNAPDPRVDNYIKPVEKHWVWRIIFRDMKPYYYVMLGSLLVNLLGLAGITYSMQTYDRIIPAQSYPTMWVLFSGVVLAFIFDFVLRLLRYGVVDILGKRADLRISDRVFGRSLRIKNSYRPRSTGTFISQLRELEQVREMMTSSTVVAIADLPFFFLFLFIIYMIGGIVFLVPLIGMFLMVIPGILCQKKLAVLAKTAMREGNLRNAMLVESVQGLDDIKYLQAEQRFQQQWIHYTSTTAESNLELKHLTHKLTTWSYSIQSGVFVCVVLVGTPLAMSGELSTGAMVACSILSSRMMAPISQIAGILTRWQQTKVAVNGLDSIMQLPTDYPENSKRVHKTNIRGEYEIKDASFKHSNEDRRISLRVDHLQIKPYEKIAILGRNGSGKSSLLNALAGLMLNEDGVVTLDKINLDLIDPADLRRDLGYLSQSSRLFYGSIRDNLTLGAPLASDDEIINALTKTNAISFVNRLPDGLEHIILEGGLGLSGGQQQALLLSRLIIRDPNIVLLDEPTAALDEVTEQEFIKNMKGWLTGKTVVISTHRKKVLELADRIIVLSQGQIILDKPRAEALKVLSGASTVDKT